MLIDSIEFYLPVMKKLGVTAVVRLNKVHYDKAVFTRNQINHYDFYFGDGTAPEERIVHDFLQVVDNEKGMIRGGEGREEVGEEEEKRRQNIRLLLR